MATLFETQDPRGFRVICTVERFEQHILAESGHEELRGHEASVKLAIRDPLAIYQDADFATREVYYRPSDLPAPYDRGFVRVVVQFSGGAPQIRTGAVITAYHAYAPKRTEVILWSKI